MDKSIIAVYCNYIDEGINSLPEHIVNRLNIADRLYRRLVASYADDSLIKVMLFGNKNAIVCKNAMHIDASMEECSNIADMASIIMNDLIEEGDDVSIGSNRIYFVLSNWQWVYVEPLLKLKDSNVKFFFEGAVDDRSMKYIDAERRLEHVVKVKGKRGLSALIDKTMGTLATDMKG